MKFANTFLFVTWAALVAGAEAGEIHIYLELKGVRFSQPHGVSGTASRIQWMNTGHLLLQEGTFSGLYGNRSLSGFLVRGETDDLRVGPYRFFTGRLEVSPQPKGSLEAEMGTYERTSHTVEFTGSVRLRSPHGEVWGREGELDLREERAKLRKVEGVLRR